MNKFILNSGLVFTSNMMYVASFFVVLILIAKFVPQSDAGYYFQAAAITNIFFQIALMNIPIAILTDVNKKFTYSQYLSFEILITAFIFIVLAPFFFILGGTKITIILLLLTSLQKIFSNFGTINSWIFQKEEKPILYLIFSIILSALVVVLSFITLIFSQDIVLLNICLVFAYAISFFYSLYLVNKKFERIKIDFLQVGKIVLILLPFGIASYLPMLIVDFQKFLLGIYWDITTVTIFSIIAYFLTVHRMFSYTTTNVLYKKISSLISLGKGREALVGVGVNCAVNLLVGILGVLIAYFLGEFFLELFFGIEYVVYANYLIVAMYVGILLALDTCIYSYVLATRSYKLQYFKDGVSIVVLLLSSFYFVNKYNILGAFYAIGFTYIIGIIIGFILSVLVYRQKIGFPAFNKN